MNKFVFLIFVFFVSSSFLFSANLEDMVFDLLEKEKKAISTVDFEKIISEYRVFLQKNNSKLSKELKESLYFSMASIFEKKLLKPKKAIDIYLELIEKNPNENYAEKIIPHLKRCLLLIPREERKSLLKKSSLFEDINEKESVSDAVCVQYDPDKIDDSMFEDISEEEILRREKELEEQVSGHIPPIMPDELDTPDGYIKRFYKDKFNVNDAKLSDLSVKFNVLYPNAKEYILGEFISSSKSFMIKMPSYSVHFYDNNEYLYINSLKSHVPVEYSSTKSKTEFVLIKEKLMFLLGLRNPCEFFYLDYKGSEPNVTVIEAYEKDRQSVYDVIYIYYFQDNPQKLLRCDIVRFSDKMVLFTVFFDEFVKENDISRSSFMLPSFSRKTRNIPNGFQGL